MKEDNVSQLGDYDVPFCEQQYTHGSCYISLLKLKSFDQLKNNNKRTKKLINRFLQDGASAGIRSLQTSIVIKLQTPWNGL